jgi:hypothetical protein
MTYNFDPERWFEIQKDALEKKRDAGEIDDEDYQALLKELVDKYEDMLQRVDIRHDYDESNS